MHRYVAGLIVLLCTAVSASQAATTNCIANPGFEDGLTGWAKEGDAEYVADISVKRSGKSSARITVPSGTALNYQKITRDAPVKPGETYRGRFWVLSDPNADGSGPYGAIEFLKEGKRVGIAHTDFQANRSDPKDWHLLEAIGVAPDGADTARLSLILHSHGTAWFDDAELVRVYAAPKPDKAQVKLILKPNETITDHWQGFGCQGDLFLYSDRTIKQGLNDDDRRLIRKRIEAMRPKFIRLAVNITDWENERGKITPDNEAMTDLKHTLAIYKRVGADVQLTEWGYGPPSWCRPIGQVPHPDERRSFTDSWASLLKYLRSDCGFTNVRYVTLYNEPNTIPWEDISGIYRALDASLKAAGLREDVKIIGPDEACENQLLPLAIRDLDSVIDYYDAHNYTGDSGREFGLWTGTRVSLMPKTQAPGMTPARKRFLVTEFGMHDGMDTFFTPHNGEYGYGLFLADSSIVACNEGVSAMSMWCIGDTDYGRRMKWGLWKFRDEGWEPRPGFYAWTLITRYTELGSTVHRLASDSFNAPAVAFRAPKDGLWTLMVVNRLDTERPVTISGLPANSDWEPFVYSEGTVPTPDREMIHAGAPLHTDGRGTMKTMLPPKSFVLWHETGR